MGAVLALTHMRSGAQTPWCMMHKQQLKCKAHSCSCAYMYVYITNVACVWALHRFLCKANIPTEWLYTMDDRMMVEVAKIYRPLTMPGAFHMISKGKGLLHATIFNDCARQRTSVTPSLPSAGSRKPVDCLTAGHICMCLVIQLPNLHRGDIFIGLLRGFLPQPMSSSFNQGCKPSQIS